MIKKKNIFLIGLFLILFLISLKFDPQIVRFFFKIRSYYLSQFLLGIAFVSSEVIIFFVLTSLFLWSERKRKWIVPLWITMFLSVLVSYGLKIIVQRPRPFEAGIVQPILLESFSKWNYSFPSFQSMLVFAAIPILAKEFKRVKYVWVIFAVLVALSRLYLGVHYFSDVLAGALIGYGIGMFIVHQENYNKIWSKLHKSLFGKKKS